MVGVISNFIILQHHVGEVTWKFFIIDTWTISLEICHRKDLEEDSSTPHLPKL